MDLNVYEKTTDKTIDIHINKTTDKTIEKTINNTIDKTIGKTIAQCRMRSLFNHRSVWSLLRLREPLKVCEKH